MAKASDSLPRQSCEPTRFCLLLAGLMKSCSVGVVLGLAFLTPPETPGGIQSLKTVLYQSGPAMFYLYIIVYVFILTNELVVFDRDREDGLYGTVPATFAYFTSYLPLNIVVPTIYAIILYFMCGFRRDSLAVNLLSFIANVSLSFLLKTCWLTEARAVHFTPTVLILVCFALQCSESLVRASIASGQRLLDHVSSLGWLPYRQLACVGRVDSMALVLLLQCVRS